MTKKDGIDLMDSEEKKLQIETETTREKERAGETETAARYQFEKEVDSAGRKSQKRGIRAPLAVLFFLVALIGGFMAGRYVLLSGTGENTGINNRAVMQKLSLLEAFVDRYFLDDVDGQEVEDKIYSGFMNGLNDPYSTYYTKKEYEQMQEEDAGEYNGIGVTVHKDTDTGYVNVDTVFKGDPAYQAGVRADDRIIAVDSEDIAEMTLTEVVSKIKEESSDTVVLSIFRENQKMELTVKKGTITIHSVEFEMKKNHIGYISISQFIATTADQFNEAVNTLTKQGMTGLVIDLRDNGGGLVDSSVDIVSRIIPKGKLIVYTKDKQGKKTEYKSNSKKTIDIPIVVLVNGNTASASEIMTGCLKDYKAATIVGTKTYGKGIVQNVIPLSDGSAIKMTVSKYYTPNGNNIHKIGIEPDVTVEMTAEEWAKAYEDESKDTQLKRAYKLLQ